MIQIDIDPSELGRSYPNEVSLHGDAKATVPKLIEALEPMGSRSDWVSRAQDLVRQWREEVAPQS